MPPNRAVILVPMEMKDKSGRKVADCKMLDEMGKEISEEEFSRHPEWRKNTWWYGGPKYGLGPYLWEEENMTEAEVRKVYSERMAEEYNRPNSRLVKLEKQLKDMIMLQETGDK